MPEMVVIDHAVTWMEQNDATKAWEHHAGFRGETHEMPDHVVARFKQLQESDGRPLVGTAEEYEDWTRQEAAAVVKPGELSDEQIDAMTPNQLLAAMNANNALASQVLELEGRKKASGSRSRRAIVEHAQRIVDAREEQAGWLTPADG